MAKRSTDEKIRTVEDLFGGGVTGRLMRHDNPRVYQWFQNRHARTGEYVCDEEGYYRRHGHEWKVPYGVRIALHQRLIHVQIVNQYPWYVVWRSPKTKKKLRRNFSSLARAIEFIAEQVQYIDRHASVVSRQYGYDIPAKLRNKIPSPWKWCPYCMTARKFYRAMPEETFYAMVKVWNETKGHYETKERKLPLLRCRFCGCTNRDSKYRRSNQPFEVRRFKKGVRRATRRRRVRGRRA